MGVSLDKTLALMLTFACPRLSQAEDAAAKEKASSSRLEALVCSKDFGGCPSNSHGQNSFDSLCT